MPGLGHKSFMQIVKESSYGAGANVGQKLEIVSWNVQPSVGIIPDPSLYSAQSRRAIYPGGALWRGTAVVRCNYTGLLELLRCVAGTYSKGSDIVATSQLPGADHLFTEGSSLPSLCIEVSHGDVPSTKVFRYVGVKLPNITVRGTAGQGSDAMLQCELTVLAKDCTANQTSTAPATISPGTIHTTVGNSATLTRSSGNFSSDGVVRGMKITGTNIPADTFVRSVDSATSLTMTKLATGGGSSLAMSFAWSYPERLAVLFHQNILTDDGTADSPTAQRWRQWEFTLENPLTEDRFYFGSQNIDEPLRSDFLTARMRITQEFATVSQYDAARSLTAGSPRIILTNGTISFVTQGGVCDVGVAATTITRDTGDFTSGPSAVKVGMRVISAHFPAYTYVTSVAATTITVDQPSLNVSPVADQTITFRVERELEVRMGTAYLTEYSQPVESYGILQATATWEGVYDPTDLSAFLIRVRNEEGQLA